MDVKEWHDIEWGVGSRQQQPHHPPFMEATSAILAKSGILIAAIWDGREARTMVTPRIAWPPSLRMTRTGGGA